MPLVTRPLCDTNENKPAITRWLAVLSQDGMYVLSAPVYWIELRNARLRGDQSLDARIQAALVA